MLDAHVVDDQQIRHQILGQHLVLTGECLVVQEVPHHVEDRAIPDREAHLDGLVADGLDQMALAGPRRTQEQHIAVFADEPAGGQIIDLFLLDRGIELPVEVLQGLEVPEGRDLDASLDLTLLSDQQFILEDQFQELGMRQMVALPLPGLGPPGTGACPTIAMFLTTFVRIGS